jgi:hypothetical protein
MIGLLSVRSPVSEGIIEDEIPMKPKLITLCGSTKFKAAFEEWNVRLTMQGAVILSIVIPSHSYGLTWTAEQKQMLDKMHLAKIDLSDEIFVLDVAGYIGESTAREIAHAKATGKSVRYLSAEYPGWVEDDAVYARP